MEKREKVWIVFYTRAGREKRAEQIIKGLIENMDLKDRVSRVLVPSKLMEKVRNIKNSIRRISLEKPIYKGYIFVEMEEDPDLVDLISKAAGIKALLKKEEEKSEKGSSVRWTFLKLSKDEIDYIEKIVELENRKKEEKTPFLKGQKVKIVAGPMKNMEGEVIDVNKEKGKLKVKVEIFGRPSEVEVDFIQVESLT
ncbi:MAG: transcription termination/antitermination protein NusG [Candidatus Hydrothermia bacterium]|jgi:transcriptional antiterminator NusG|nr:transcription termination/antitermination protein NusG [Candidatus Hydrothermia bacterium]